MKSTIEIYCGDVLKLIKDVPNETIDLIIADPPYNLGKNYGNNNDKLSFHGYLDFTRKWLSEAKRVLKKTGTIYVFMGVRFVSYLYEVLDKKLNMNFVSWIIWYYTQGMGKKIGFSPRHDDILMFTKSKIYTFNLDDIRVPQKYYRSRNNMRGANPGDVWEFSHIHYCNFNRQNHSTQKPEGLIEKMVLASSNKADVILDPFAGSGTTLRVCQQTNRKAKGFEINPKYVELIKQRLKNPFRGFDSIDPRMKRIPKDLNDPKIREEYLKNHEKWFLKNHESNIKDFHKNIRMKYNSM